MLTLLISLFFFHILLLRWKLQPKSPPSSSNKPCFVSENQPNDERSPRDASRIHPQGSYTVPHPQKSEGWSSCLFIFPSPFSVGLENHLGAFYRLILGIFQSGLIWSDLDCCIGGEAYRGREMFPLSPKPSWEGTYNFGLCWGTCELHSRQGNLPPSELKMKTQVCMTLVHAGSKTSGVRSSALFFLNT